MAVFLPLLIVGLVLLVIILIAWVKKPRPSMLVVEPISTLVKTWKVARIDGQERKVRQYLELIRQAKFDNQSPVQTILGKTELAKTSPVGRVSLLDQKAVGLLAEELLLEWSGNIIALGVGDIEDLADTIQYFANAQTKFTTEQTQNLIKSRDQAGRHGFICLALTSRVVHRGQKFEETGRYTYLGTVFLEPSIDDKQKNQLLRSSEGQGVRFLSKANSHWLEWLIERLGLAKGQVISGKELAKKELAEQDKLLSLAQGVGQVSPDQRYLALKNWQEHYKIETLD